MRILIAEDEVTSRLLLVKSLESFGHEVVVTEDGLQAQAALQKQDAPHLIILDRMMPGMDGIGVCSWLRQQPWGQIRYVLMLTALDKEDDIVEGLNAGASDYLAKPLRRNELEARVRVGERVLELQEQLAQRVADLEAALLQVKTLHGLLSICSYCKKIRDDKNYWTQVEGYIEEHTNVSFSHGICPDCYTSIVEPQLRELEKQAGQGESDDDVEHDGIASSTP